MKKLNVGSGKDIREGWTNLDNHGTFGADTLFNLNNIFEGKKLPFRDNVFDYVYCSHVLEDFIDPVPIMDELVRVCNKGGKIEIKVPFETNTNMNNIHHKKHFTLSILKSYSEQRNYGIERDVSIFFMEYYPGDMNSLLLKTYSKVGALFYNFLGQGIVENSFIKYLFPCVNIRIIYKKK